MPTMLVTGSGTLQWAERRVPALMGRRTVKPGRTADLRRVAAPRPRAPDEVGGWILGGVRDHAGHGQWAHAAGIPLDHSPAVGAIAWYGSGITGHVAFVERVNSPASVVISELNVDG